MLVRRAPTVMANWTMIVIADHARYMAMREETVQEYRARQSREFLERNASKIARMRWEMKSEADLKQHRLSQGLAE